MDIQLLIPVIAGGIRNIAGWLESSMKDGVIDKYEWGQLGSTIIRVGLIGLGLIYGLNLEPMAAGASAVVLDFVLSALKKK